MWRPNFVFLSNVVIAATVALIAVFMFHVVPVMQAASRAGDGVIARFGSPMGEIGVAIALIIASLGALLACLRYVGTVKADERPPMKLPLPSARLVKRAVVLVAALVLIALALLSYRLYPQGPLGALFPPEIERTGTGLGEVLDYDPFKEDAK